MQLATRLGKRAGLKKKLNSNSVDLSDLASSLLAKQSQILLHRIRVQKFTHKLIFIQFIYTGSIKVLH